MGLYTIVCSIPGNYPGFKYADKVYYVNTVDKKKILEIAIAEGIDGILTTGTDVAVKTIGYVCDKLKLNGISHECADSATDKALMKRKLIDGNVRTGQFKKVYSIDEAIMASEEIGLPVMIKCVDKSGSRGIRKVEDKLQISEAVEYSFSYTNADYIIVEKFLNGYEIGVDGYIGNDKFYCWPHKKITYNKRIKIFSKKNSAIGNLIGIALKV